MDFTKKFIKNNFNKNENNKVTKNSKIIDFNSIDLKDIFEKENNDNILIHYTLDNDKKFITIYINPNDINYYYFDLHFSKDFDIKEMLLIFLNRTNKKIGIDLIENENKQILRYR